jgi:hypothetical protein
MFAAHAWDLQGAAHAGLREVWNPLASKPGYDVRDLAAPAERPVR